MPHETIAVARPSMPLFEEYCEEIRGLWESRILSNGGEKHRQLEGALQDYLGVERVALFVNGHAALECALEAMELGGDGRNEVVTTPFTFASTTHAIVRKGLKPVFCDVKPDDFTIDPEKIKPLISDKTCAILPVHVYGNLCDVDAIKDIANYYGLKVIYDAAHAFGVKRGGIGAGCFGDASVFSFHATKVFNTVEGGAVAYGDGELSDKFAQWRNFGIVGPESVAFAGGNSKMNEFSAAMGLCNLRHVDEEIAKRKVVAERYWECLGGIPGISFCCPPENVEYNYAYLPALFDSAKFGATRDDVFDSLACEGVKARKYFYPLTSDFDCYKASHDSSLTPIAKSAAERVLTLPMYADLALQDVDRICDVIVGTR